MKMKLSMWCSVLLCMSSFSMAQGVKVGTSVAAPYQVKEGTEVSGSVVDLVQCALAAAKTPYELAVVPWKRATNSLQSGKLDMIFSYAETAELESIAHFSTPLVLEKWYWYSKESVDVNDPSTAVTVILGSNQEAWLAEKGYSNVSAVSSMENAVKMLDIGRAKVLLTDQQLALAAAKKVNINLEGFSAQFARFSTLGAYISKDYVAANPTFLSSFNEKVLECKPVGIVLDKATHEVLEKVATDIQTWLRVSLVGDAVMEANSQRKGMSESDILALDKQWRAETKSESRPLIDKTLANDLSAYLTQVKKDKGGLYSEIFIMDAHGLNVGQSDITSDYWQGDEGKFKKSFGANSKTPFIDGIEFDESSESFQSQVSLTIYDAAGSTPIGAVTVGVNVEKALGQ